MLLRAKNLRIASSKRYAHQHRPTHTQPNSLLQNSTQLRTSNPNMPPRAASTPQTVGHPALSLVSTAPKPLSRRQPCTTHKRISTPCTRPISRCDPFYGPCDIRATPAARPAVPSIDSFGHKPTRLCLSFDLSTKILASAKECLSSIGYVSTTAAGTATDRPFGQASAFRPCFLFPCFIDVSNRAAPIPMAALFTHIKAPQIGRTPNITWQS